MGIISVQNYVICLVNAVALCCRLIRIVLQGIRSIDSFVDDMWIFFQNLKDKMASLRQVLDRLMSAKLTTRPSK